MEPFTLHIFHNGREFEFRGVMPHWLQQTLGRGNFLAWYGFLRGCQEQVALMEAKYPKGSVDS